MQDSTMAICPYCGSENHITIEPGHSDQEWIEDCSTCCQPILFSLTEDSGEWQLQAERP